MTIWWWWYYHSNWRILCSTCFWCLWCNLFHALQSHSSLQYSWSCWKHSQTASHRHPTARDKKCDWQSWTYFPCRDEEHVTGGAILYPADRSRQLATGTAGQHVPGRARQFIKFQARRTPRHRQGRSSCTISIWKTWWYFLHNMFGIYLYKQWPILTLPLCAVATPLHLGRVENQKMLIF